MRHSSTICQPYPLFQLPNSTKHMISGIKPITPFTSPTESTADTKSIWTLYSHAGVYVTAIGLLIPAGLEIICYYFFWFLPATLAW